MIKINKIEPTPTGMKFWTDPWPNAVWRSFAVTGSRPLDLPVGCKLIGMGTNLQNQHFVEFRTGADFSPDDSALLINLVENCDAF